MDQAVEAVLAEYAEREAHENETARRISGPEMMARRDEFLISVGPETGRLLNMLARAVAAKRIIELGTSYGYSTVWLAEAARDLDARVYSFDVDPKKQAYAHERLVQAGLDHVVAFECGDARALLPRVDGPYDLVLIDLWKDLYLSCFELCYPKLRPGSLVIADNMLQPLIARPDALDYRRHVRAKPHIESVLLPMGSGIEISRYAASLED